MKKLLYLVLVPIIGLALMPPMKTEIPIYSSPLYTWLVIIFGFLGVLTLFFKINSFIKCFAILGFINTFFSACPFISHFAYIELILCVYLYTACVYIEDWKIVFNALWAVLIVNIILFIMQFIHKDNILNFGLVENISSLSIGNGMQAKSLMIVLVAILMQDKRLPDCYIIRPVFYWITFFFCIYYFFAHHVLANFLYARGPVWVEGVRLGLQRPIMGWGIGEWKTLFPAMGQGDFTAEGAWYSAHNFTVQLFFEMGLLGLVTLGLYLKSIWRKCVAKEELFIGLLLVICTLSVHFPAFQTTSCCLVVLFFAYIERTQNDNAITA